MAGNAGVLSVSDCPPIKEGRGRLVTGTFRHYSQELVDVNIQGQIPLGCTSGHPFWSEDRRAFVPAHELRTGERLKTAGDRITFVASVTKRAAREAVYNLEVDIEHVYHVGETGVLVHNARGAGCTGFHDSDGPSSSLVHRKYVEKVRPGAKEKVFGTPWSNKGEGTRKFDDYDSNTKTAFEGNTTPWSEITHDQLSRKLAQVGSDYALLKTNPNIKRVIWFGTEELPHTGLGGMLRTALQEANIEYWVVKP